MNVVLRENQQELRQRRLEKLHNGELNGVASSFDIVKKVKQSRYRPVGPRVFQKVKVHRFRDNGAGWW